MQRKFVISDIHGCFKTFEHLLQRIQFSKTDQLFLLGDYIDRGAYSKEVLDAIIQKRANGYNIKCLMGNHEWMFLRARKKETDYDTWLKYGGSICLQSFGVASIEDIPQVYFDFLENLPFYHIEDEFILVHAGLDFDLIDPFYGENAMLWIRNWYKNINYKWLNNRIIIHGHTPQAMDKCLLQLDRLNACQYLNIDLGCSWYQRMGYGILCAFELTKRQIFFERNMDSETTQSKRQVLGQ